MMRSEARTPGYAVERNEGYPCPWHKIALRGKGLAAIHRTTWVFMDHLPYGVKQLEADVLAPDPTLF